MIIWSSRSAKQRRSKLSGHSVAPRALARSAPPPATPRSAVASAAQSAEAERDGDEATTILTAARTLGFMSETSRASSSLPRSSLSRLFLNAEEKAEEMEDCVEPAAADREKVLAGPGRSEDEDDDASDGERKADDELPPEASETSNTERDRLACVTDADIDSPEPAASVLVSWLSIRYCAATSRLSWQLTMARWMASRVALLPSLRNFDWTVTHDAG